MHYQTTHISPLICDGDDVFHIRLSMKRVNLYQRSIPAAEREPYYNSLINHDRGYKIFLSAGARSEGALHTRTKNYTVIRGLPSTVFFD